MLLKRCGYTLSIHSAILSSQTASYTLAIVKHSAVPKFKQSTRNFINRILLKRRFLLTSHPSTGLTMDSKSLSIRFKYWTVLGAGCLEAFALSFRQTASYTRIHARSSGGRRSKELNFRRKYSINNVDSTIMKIKKGL